MPTKKENAMVEKEFKKVKRGITLEESVEIELLRHRVRMSALILEALKKGKRMERRGKK